MKTRLSYLSWNKIAGMCRQLSSKISRYEPDVLIGIARGGLVPARILSDITGNSNLAIIRIEFYAGIGKTKGKPKITQRLTSSIKGKKVLLIDDVADSGKSLMAARKYVIGKKPEKLRTATLHYKPWSIIKPDYYVKKTESWLVYPWETNEARMELKRKK